MESPPIEINIPTAGLVTVNDWMMSTAGVEVKYLWASRWEIVTDKTIGTVIGDESFRSAEKWSLMAIGINNEVLMWIPGCRVAGFVTCIGAPPPNQSSNRVFNVSEGVVS